MLHSSPRTWSVSKNCSLYSCSHSCIAASSPSVHACEPRRSRMPSSSVGKLRKLMVPCSCGLRQATTARTAIPMTNSQKQRRHGSRAHRWCTDVRLAWHHGRVLQARQHASLWADKEDTQEAGRALRVLLTPGKVVRSTEGRDILDDVHEHLCVWRNAVPLHASVRTSGYTGVAEEYSLEKSTYPGSLSWVLCRGLEWFELGMGSKCVGGARLRSRVAGNARQGTGSRRACTTARPGLLCCCSLATSTCPGRDRCACHQSAGSPAWTSRSCRASRRTLLPV